MASRRRKVSFRTQKETAYDVLIKNYSYIVGHVKAIRIFPHLVSSKLVEPDFRQRLDCKQTDKEKMMELLDELMQCTEETWFDGFTNALSKVPQYETVADTLLEDFARTFAEKAANPIVENDSTDVSVLSNGPIPVVSVTVVDVDEMMKKAMQEAKKDHNAAITELKKMNAHLLEAEKEKISAEADIRALAKKVQEVENKLCVADDKLREAERHKQLLKRRAQIYKDDADEPQWERKVELMKLSANNAELRLQLKASKEKEQKLKEGMTVLEKRVASLLAEIEKGRREREEEEVASHECQLSDARRQQQFVAEECTVKNLL